MARITKKLNKQFRHNRLALIDELNIVGVKKHIKKLYTNSQRIIKNEFLETINLIYQEAYDEAFEAGFDGTPDVLDEDWIDEFLNDYNPTTKYVFNNEIERKKQYLQEDIIAEPDDINQAYEKAEKRLIKQVKQGGIDLDDAVVRKAFEDSGVQKVTWNAEDDGKTCGDCRELDGQIFELKDLPPKQHHNCRCWFTPVKE